MMNIAGVSFSYPLSFSVSLKRLCDIFISLRSSVYVKTSYMYIINLRYSFCSSSYILNVDTREGMTIIDD